MDVIIIIVPSDGTISVQTTQTNTDNTKKERGLPDLDHNQKMDGNYGGH